MMNQINKKIMEYLSEFIKEIEHYYQLNCVILFGSQARGNFKPYSDIDLIFVGEFKEKFTKRGDSIYEKHNWKYIARYSVWKEPLGVRNRTMAKKPKIQTKLKKKNDF